MNYGLTTEEIIRTSSKDLEQIAKEEGVERYSKLSKDELIEALSPEPIPVGILGKNKTEGLVPMAKEHGIKSPHAKTKDDLRVLLVEKLSGDESEDEGSGSAVPETGGGQVNSGLNWKDFGPREGLLLAKEYRGRENFAEAYETAVRKATDFALETKEPVHIWLAPKSEDGEYFIFFTNRSYSGRGQSIGAVLPSLIA